MDHTTSGRFGRRAYSREELKDLVGEIALENSFVVTWQE